MQKNESAHTRYGETLCAVPPKDAHSTICAEFVNAGIGGRDMDELYRRWNLIQLGTEPVVGFEFGERVIVTVSLPWSVMQAEPYKKDTVRAAELAKEALAKHL